MSATTQYFIIIILYFVAMLGVGFIFNRKVSSDMDYFLAKDKLGPAAIGFSFSATQMSGSTYLGAVGQCKVLGYNFIPAAIASASAPWFSYILVGDRMRKVSSRLKSVTLSDVFEARYGKSSSLISVAIIIIASIPMIAAQLKAAANSFEVLLGIPYWAGLLVFGGIVILYTVLGGMFAVAWTDLIQGIIMIVGFAILAPVAVSAAGGFSQMHAAYAQINPAGMGFTGVMPLLWVVSGFWVYGFFQIGGSPASTTRFLITSDDKTLKKALVYSVGFQSFIYICFTLIAIAAGVLLPALENTDMTVPMLMQNLLPPIVGGIVLAAALGAMMSTIDSILLMTGSLVTNNIYVKMMHGESNSKKGLTISRVVTLVIGLLGLVVAINPPASVLWIVTISFSLMASAFTFPLMLGLWWPKCTKAAGTAGIIGGAVACVFWYVMGYVQFQSFSNWPLGIWPAIFGGVVSLIICVVVSLFTKKPSQEVIDVFFDDILIKD
ncbi:sodium:solute symporter family protein [Zongyangia hominis]|uniref:Sodium/solute symporter n=1 Tax=Zongyangia hominis TaxID=2763677 RepID=A0A926EGG1_9FIRM|nr:sodium/solute symporter [Zongyangia hominis]MBC8571227.1 sodium/solute symporter [Zongyangia hominis]